MGNRIFTIYGENQWLWLGLSKFTHNVWKNVVEFNSSVNIHGLNINDGDIIHADKHGAVIIPDQAISIIKKAINHMTKKEKHLIEAAKQENFNIIH